MANLAQSRRRQRSNTVAVNNVLPCTEEQVSEMKSGEKKACLLYVLKCEAIRPRQCV